MTSAQIRMMTPKKSSRVRIAARRRGTPFATSQSTAPDKRDRDDDREEEQKDRAGDGVEEPEHHHRGGRGEHQPERRSGPWRAAAARSGWTMGANLAKPPRVASPFSADGVGLVQPPWR